VQCVQCVQQQFCSQLLAAQKVMTAAGEGKGIVGPLHMYVTAEPVGRPPCFWNLCGILLLSTGVDYTRAT
jgi:hypothetical protein